MLIKFSYRDGEHESGDTRRHILLAYKIELDYDDKLPFSFRLMTLISSFVTPITFLSIIVDIETVQIAASVLIIHS